MLKLTDGRFTLTGPMGAGNPANLGPCALIEIDGVRVMVVSRKMQALDQAILRHVGIEPAECRILALKSSVHFRADFGPIAERVIVAASPGPVVADLLRVAVPQSAPGAAVAAGRQPGVDGLTDGSGTMDAETLKRRIKVCMFDQYGTVVDMQRGLWEVARRFLRRRAGRAMRILSSPGGGGRISRTR